MGDRYPCGRRAGDATFGDVTDTASLPNSRSAGLPAAWWAPALTLTERLAAPGVPGTVPAARTAAGLEPWAVGDAAGFARRLRDLGVDDATAAALAAEPAEELAARACRPRWAEYAEAVLAAAPERVAEVEIGGTGADVFAPVVRPLVCAATARLAERLDGVAEDEATVWRDAFARRLTGQLVRQAARTLVRELAEARRAGRLSGTDPRERFVSFVAAAGSRRGLASLFTAYPVLARVLTVLTLDAADAAAELVARFEADRAALTQSLLDGRDPGRLVHADLGRGDAHQGNRSVAILHFADGSRIVHKPRPVGQHALLDDLVAWLDTKVPGLGLRTPRVLRRDTHGWLEFVEHRWCVSVTETDAFYRRQGALLALLYAVDGADMHYENLIAHGDQPVLVDAETLLHTGLPQALTTGADPAADALAASVQRTCLLPHLLIGEHGALDISALGRDTDGITPSEGLRWEDSGLDTMRAVRGPLPSPAAQNHPLPHGTSLDGADHTAALLGGFRTAYAAIAAHRDELLADDGPLAPHLDRPARLIARPTRLYATLLEESTHPALLGDALAREGVFALLWTESEQDPARRRLIEHEIAALWRGDVPFLTHRPSGTAVFADGGAELPALLPVPAAEAVRRKIRRMDEVDCLDQEWIIAAALAVRGAGSPLSRPRSELAPVRVPPGVAEPPRLLAAACGIADELVARAVRDGGRANWIGLERVAGNHWAVLPMGAGLAQGYCGTALFLAHAEALTGCERYGAVAREAVRPLPALLKSLAQDPESAAAAGPGAYDGLGGILYAVVRLAKLVDEGLEDCLPDALTALGHAVAACAEPGPAQGRAGALAAAVAAHEATGAPEALALADRVADLLQEAAGTGPAPAGGADGGRGPDGRGRTGHGHGAAHGAPSGTVPGAGFGDGAAGVAWALERYAAHRPERAARARAAARALRAAAPAAADEDLSWLDGLAGRAAAGAPSSGGATAEHAPADVGLADASSRLAGAEVRPDLSLARGVLGRLEALTVLAEHGDDTARAALRRQAGQVLSLVEAREHRCATPDHVPTPGLLNGLAGIGHGLLRLAHPETVPSVLLLHHPHT